MKKIISEHSLDFMQSLVDFFLYKNPNFDGRRERGRRDDMQIMKIFNIQRGLMKISGGFIHFTLQTMIFIENMFLQTGNVTQLQSACLIHTNTWVRAPTLHKLGVVVHVYNLRIWEVERIQEFKIFFYYILSSRSCGDT